MDNAAFHKTATTPELSESTGHTLLFLPQDSPDLNPIEEDCATIKKRLPDTPLDDIIRAYGT